MINYYDKERADLVTVIIPTYNRPNLLLRAVESVLSQTHENLDIIVADDASSNETIKVCERLKDKDNRVRIYRSKKNIGAAALRNRAINISEGKYVCFLDDDDTWLPEKVTTQLEFISDYSIVACRSKRVDGYTVVGGLEIKNDINLHEIKYSGPKAEPRTLNDIFFNNGNMSPSSIMVKREHLLLVEGFDEALPSSQGRDLFVRLVSNFGDAILINKYLTAHYQHHDLQRITTSKKSLAGGWMELDKHKHLMPRRLVAWRTYVLCMKEASLSEGFREKMIWILKGLLYLRPFYPIAQFKVFVAKLFLS